MECKICLVTDCSDDGDRSEFRCINCGRTYSAVTVEEHRCELKRDEVGIVEIDL